jgi:hypothetical protein
VKGIRLLAQVLDCAVWVAAGYLVFLSASLVFGRLIGEGVFPVLLVTVLSVIGTATSIRAFGRSMVPSSPTADLGARFSLWMSRLFLLVMLGCFIIWASRSRV